MMDVKLKISKFYNTFIEDRRTALWQVDNLKNQVTLVKKLFLILTYVLKPPLESFQKLGITSSMFLPLPPLVPQRNKAKHILTK